MATRTNSLESKILAALTEWESSAESPATLQEVMGEFELSDKEAYDILGKLEDAGKINSDGRWLTSVWFLGKGKEETPAPVVKPKRTRRTKAQMEAARAEAANRTAYAANVAESQDGDMQHATPRVIAAETPVKDSQGETVTVPVDYDNPSAGRRELDASQGEKIIAEDDMRAIIRRIREEIAGNASDEQITALVTQEVRGEFSVTLHTPKNGECPGNEIPPLPQGVNPNTWELAHDANTESARDHWKRVAKQQAEEYAARMGDDVPPF